MLKQSITVTVTGSLSPDGSMTFERGVSFVGTPLTSKAANEMVQGDGTKPPEWHHATVAVQHCIEKALRKTI